MTNAIRKYGIDAFQWEIVDVAASKEELNNKEIDYIKVLRSHEKEYGFNLTTGGNSPQLSKETKLKMSASMLRQIKERGHPAKGVIHDEKFRESIRRRTSQPVICNETQKVYSSGAEASRILGIAGSLISGCIHGNLPIAGGFTFDFVNEKDKSQIDSKKVSEIRCAYKNRSKVAHNAKKIICVESGMVYDSSTLAAQALNAPLSSVARAARLGVSYRGMRFQYLSVIKSEELSPQREASSLAIQNQP